MAIKLQSCFTKGGGRFYYDGSLEADKFLVLIGRDNFPKDNALVPCLLEKLKQEGRTIIWYENKDTTVKRMFIDVDKNQFFFGCFREQLKAYIKRYPRASLRLKAMRCKLKTIFKGLLLFRHPRHLQYLREQNRNPKIYDIGAYCREFRDFIKSLGAKKEIYVVGRSAGGRIASLVADELGLKRLICLGYPFQIPPRPVEEERFAHLAYIQTPCLILQGEHDELGGRDLLSRCTFSPSVKVSWVDTDHGFRLSDEKWNEVIRQIEQHMTS